MARSHEPAYRGLSLAQLAALEVKIFIFHHGNEEAELQSFQYGIFQQLLSCDPVSWILNVLLRKKRQLIALPQPLRNVSVSTNPSNHPADPTVKDRSKISMDPMGHSWVHLLVDGAVNNKQLMFQTSFLPLIKKGDMLFVGRLTTESQLQLLRHDFQPLKFNMMGE